MSGGWSWTRRGLLVAPPPSDDVWRTHAQAPTVLALSERLWRVYFAARDAGNRTHPYAAELDPEDGMRVLAIRRSPPVVAPSAPGRFDAAGLGASCALPHGERVRLYYTGFFVRTDVPHHQAVGLAESDDGLRFERVAEGPVFTHGIRDPYFVSMPFVRRTASGYEMWYTSGTGWYDGGGRLEATYALRRTVSADGVLWSAESEPALAIEGRAPFADTRPWIARTGGRDELWFSSHGPAFRDGGAEAYRLFHAPLDASGTRAVAPVSEVAFENPPQPGEWDAQMQCYACVVPYEDGLAMFYNGNGFGTTGFGWAIGVRR